MNLKNGFGSADKDYPKKILHMKYSVLLLLSLILSSCTVQSSKQENSAQTEVKFDQKLATTLGADERGMKNYMLVILKTGPRDSVITDKNERSELFKGHFSNMEVMEKAGKLIMAGPFATKNDLGYRGLFLLDVNTADEAKNLISADPTIKNGIFSYEIMPWYGSAAIPAHLPVHKRIQKPAK